MPRPDKSSFIHPLRAVLHRERRGRRGGPACPPATDANVGNDGNPAHAVIASMAALAIALLCGEGTHARVPLHDDYTMTCVDRAGCDEYNARAACHATQRRP